MNTTARICWSCRLDSVRVVAGQPVCTEAGCSKPQDPRLPEPVRDRIDVSDSGHWWWRGSTNNAGYGRYGTDYVHRLVHTLLVGPIAEGLEVDHLCMKPLCVNPTHLETVTGAENHRRRAAAYTKCRRKGHDLTVPENLGHHTDGRRYCRACTREDQRVRHALRRGRTTAYVTGEPIDGQARA